MKGEDVITIKHRIENIQSMLNIITRELSGIHEYVEDRIEV